MPDPFAIIPLAPESGTSVRRRGRKRPVRARTEDVRRLPVFELRRGAQLYPPDPDDPPRPRTRAECESAPRPCPFASCRYHLALDVLEDTGSIKHNFPDLEVDELAETCALDVAERGPATLETVARLMNVTRERVRQLELGLLRRLARFRAFAKHREDLG